MDDAASKHAEEIFCAALDFGEDERPRFLASTCGEDHELRRTVEELLAAHAAAGSFLTQPVDNAQVTAALHACGAGEQENPFVLERYRLIERIGEGGMGVVWRAEQVVGVQRTVAVKVVKGGFATAEMMARFEMERQTLAWMNHPNIAKVLDVGATSNGRPFFVMELVMGKPLLAFCDEHRLSIRDRLRLFQQVCDAVQHAHQKGIIHRDLKSGNILVEHGDGGAVPKVIDFGLAKAVGEHFGVGTPRTAVGVMLGTPAYMSPEQTMLCEQDIDTRSDIFSLGALLYELLTGTTPLPRDELARLSLHAAFVAVCENEPPAPSGRLKRLGERLASIATQRSTTPEQLVSIVRGDLDSITLKALEKDRGRRYQTASELAADVGRHLTDEPVVARPMSVPDRLGKLVRRHRLAAGLTAGLVVALVAGAAISLALMFRARESEAELAALATFLTDDVLAAARPKGVQGGLGIDITVRDALVAAREQIPGRFAGWPRAEALTRHALGVTFDNMGEAERAVAELERAWALRRDLLGEQHPKTLSTMSSLGQAYLGAGRLQHAITLLRDALQGQEAVLGPGHADTVTTMIMLGKTYSRADDTPNLARAISLCEQALERSVQSFGPNSPKRYACMVYLGGAYFLAGRFSEATTLHEKALGNFRTTFPPPHPFTVGLMSDLALDYMGARRFRKAIDLQREVMELQKEQLGEEHPAFLASMSSLAYDYLLSGDFAAAEATARKCFAVRKRTLGDTHFDTLTIAVTLVQSLLGQNKHEVAEPLIREIIAEREKTMPDEWRTHASRMLLGESLVGNRQMEEGVRILEEGFQQLKTSRAKIPIWSPAGHSSLVRIARLYAARGEAAPAAVWEARQKEWATWIERRRAEIERRNEARAASIP